MADYKQKYEEALKRAEQFKDTPYLENSDGIVEYIFPELAESEEEKIRKELIRIARESSCSFCMTITPKRRVALINLLEKLGEQDNNWKPCGKIPQWIKIKKGEKLPCRAYLMRKDGVVIAMPTMVGTKVGDDAYYLPCDKLNKLPKEG